MFRKRKMDVQPILLSIFAKNGYYCLLDTLLLKIKTFLDNLFGIKTNNNRLIKLCITTCI